MIRPLVLAIGSEKGGVGKTAAVANLLAAYLAKGMSCVGIDLDPLGHLGTSWGLRGGGEGGGELAELLDGPDEERPTTQAVLASWRHRGDVDNLVILSGQKGPMERAERALEVPGGAHRLAEIIEAIPAAAGVDVIIIDTPPRFGVMTEAATRASTAVLGVTEATMDAAVELRRLQSFVEKTGRRDGCAPLGYLGTIIALFDPAQRNARNTLVTLQEAGYEPLNPPIPRRAAFRERYVMGTPLTYAKPTHPISVAYAALADEILARVESAERAGEAVRSA